MLFFNLRQIMYVKHPNHCRILSVLFVSSPPEHAAKVPHEVPQLGSGRYGDPGLGVVTEPHVVIKIETEPAKVTAGLLHDLVSG